MSRRHHGDIARLEVPQDLFPLALEHHAELNDRIGAVGYHYVALDLGGFKSGSLNKTLNASEIQVVRIGN